MADVKPIILYGRGTAPNPVKVAFILEELGLPYEVALVEDVKGEAFTKLNPNGRVPAIHDPNSGITLWESGAIIEYLIETYDKDGKLSYSTSPEKYYQKQYLHFQTSGQGPYYGQYGWFTLYHPEKIPSAIERYKDQIWRVVSVLDKILEGREYLVGDKLTYADLAFVPWEQANWHFNSEHTNEAGEKMFDQYPNYVAWYNRVVSRPSIAKATAVIKAKNDEKKAA